MNTQPRPRPAKAPPRADNQDIKPIRKALGMTEGANSQPDTFVLEKAFVG